MAQPPIYSRAYDFSAFQTSNPQNPLPAAQVEAELDRIKSTLDAVLNNMAILQRDDTQLANQSVTAESLSQDALAIAQADGFNIRGDWATGIYYEINDVVDFNDATYICINAHTSASTFDSLAAHWLLLANAAIDTSASAVDQFLGTGSQAVFTLSYIYSSNTDVLVFVDGQLNTPVDDYSITQNTITFVNPPSTPAVAGRENVIIWGPTVTTANAVTNARQAETNAAGSEVAALASQQAAAASAVTASGHENAAGVSAAAALVSEQAALGSENASSASEQAADASEQAALASQNAANVSAAAALASEQAADASEQASLSSEQTATTQASNAAASAVTAEQHKDDAESAKTAAQSARDSALSALDNFEDNYLGDHSSDPTTDGDGDPLTAGSIYFNTTDNVVKVYSGSAWVVAYADGTTLVAKAGDTMTGALSINADLTVDTDTLHVDSTNNRVGILTSSPDTALHVKSSATADTISRVENTVGYAANLNLKATGNYSFTTYEGGTKTWIVGQRGLSSGLYSVYDVDNAAHRLVIDGSGNVGINTSSPSKKFDVSSTNLSTVKITGYTANSGLPMYSYSDSGGCGWSTGDPDSQSQGYANLMYLRDTDNSFSVYLGEPGAATHRMKLETDGDLHVDGNVVAYSTTVSDIRLKKDIAPIEDAVTKVQQLNGCTFTYLKDDRQSAGIMAQDLEKVLPSAVIEDEGVFHGEEGETYKTVQYDQVIGLLVEAVKELKAEIEELKNGTAK